MKLEEIQELWNRDREIDIAELAIESVRIPQLHDKYLKIYIDERIKLKSLEFELSKMVRLKNDYYSGRMAKEDKRGETFELEVVLHYKNTDGSTGSIIKVKSLKK